MEEINNGVAIKTIIKIGNKEIELNEEELKELIAKLGIKSGIQYIPYPVYFPSVQPYYYGTDSGTYINGLL
jgi:hypothetical protein